MRAHRVLPSLVCIVGCVAMLSGCAGGATPSGASLPTDQRVVAASAAGVACVPSLAMNHLQGDVHIDLAKPDAVTVRVTADREVNVRWPSGFTLIVDSAPHVVDPRGRSIAVDGTTLSFPPVALESAAGTVADPYILQGRIGEDCYVPTEILD